MKQKIDKKLIIYIFFSAFIFSTMEVALKIGVNQFDPLQVTLLRFIIGAVFLLPFAISDLRKRQVHLTKGDHGYLCFMGIFCVCVSMLLFQFGVMNSYAGTAAVVFSVNPMFTMMFAHFITDEKLTKRKGLALTISLVGILVMINPFHMAQGNTTKGILLIILAALTFGLYSAFGKFRIGKLGGLAQTSLSFLWGSLGLAVIMVIQQRPIFAGLHLAAIPTLLYLGVVVTGIGYFFYFKAMEIGGPGKASIVFFLKPVIAPVVALVMLGEAITLPIIAGVGILLVGSFISMTEKTQTSIKQ